MKRVFGLLAGMAMVAASAQASNINVTVQGPNGEAAVTVEPNGTVDYRIVADLNDGNSEGLALIGLSLNYTGGDIGEQAANPGGAVTCGNPMPAFVVPDGIGNPAGYGGTMIGGDLIQIGGAQNTINNTADNAPFPIGAVLTGVAKPGACGQAIIATGSFDIGAAEGDFQLQAFDVFANVIRTGETGVPFWATEAAGVGTVTNLTVHVVAGGVVANFVSSVPAFTAVGVQAAPSQGTLWRTSRNTLRLTFNSPVVAPTAGQLLIQPLQNAGAFGGDISNNFAFSVEGGTVLRVRDNAGNMPHQTWFAMRNTGGWPGVAPFEIHFPVNQGDANGNGLVQFNDLGFINTQVPSAAADNARRDINGDGNILFNDLGAANSKIPSDLVPKPTGH